MGYPQHLVHHPLGEEGRKYFFQLGDELFLIRKHIDGDNHPHHHLDDRAGNLGGHRHHLGEEGGDKLVQKVKDLGEGGLHLFGKGLVGDIGDQLVNQLVEALGVKPNVPHQLGGAFHQHRQHHHPKNAQGRRHQQIAPRHCQAAAGF